MTYEDLKLFCNNLTEEQLKQEAELSRVDQPPIKIVCGHITTEDTWFDSTDFKGNKSILKDEYGDKWETVAENYTKIPIGTVMLCDE